MKFMVSIQFRSEDQAKITPLVPQEQARGKELMEQGVLEVLYSSSDNSHYWLLMKSASRDQLQMYLESFPLYSYYRQLEVTALVG